MSNNVDLFFLIRVAFVAVNAGW